MRTVLLKIAVLSIMTISAWSPGWGADTSPHIYPLPIAETSHLVTGWLLAAGLHVKQGKTEQGQIRISGADADRSWQIDLEPRSPLSTAVIAQYSTNGKARSEFSDIYEYLQNYPQTPPRQGPLPISEIPEVILEKLDSSVCLYASVHDEPIEFSGFFIDKAGLILSTAHGLKEQEKVVVSTANGLEYQGDIVKLDTERDLALIKIPANHETRIALESGRNLLGPGEQIYSIGCPDNQPGTVFAGRISGPPRRLGQMPFWQVSMEIQPGNSGSPVFDEQGALVAVIMGRYRGTDTTGFLIPIETIMDFLKSFLAK